MLRNKFVFIKRSNSALKEFYLHTVVEKFNYQTLK